MEINEATQRFIADNRDGDVRQLALRGSRTAGVDLPFALDQIRGRQVAAAKMPRWAATEGIVYPPHLSLEQSSGEPTSPAAWAATSASCRPASGSAST